MERPDLVIGIDFGTDSARALIVDSANGAEIATHVHPYPRWAKGKYCDPAKNLFRQHPLDHLEALEKCVKGAIKRAPKGSAARVAALSVDTTGSTPGPVDRNGTALALLPGFRDDPDAMFVLWKDHTAVAEAAEINALAHGGRFTDYTRYSGGVYSSEWFWSKILHVLRRSPAVRRAAFSWVEHCDWVPAVLTGKTDPLSMKRSRCAAGHKALWHAGWDGLPGEEFLCGLDPLLKGLRGRLYRETVTADKAAGTLCREWAGRLGLSEKVVVGTGAFDAHMGAVGGGITPHVFAKIMGTSTCDILMAPLSEIGDRLIKGICGQVDGSVMPGMLGMEAGQSAFGDVYAWFQRLITGPVEGIVSKSRLLSASRKKAIVREITDALIPRLSGAAEKLPLDGSGELALDWMNGRRTPFANQLLKGAVTGINLGSDAGRIFRALVQATAFGARKIVDRFLEEGVAIRGIIAMGGVAKKSPYVMQVMADALDMPIRVARSEQACALGAAMFAATAAGIHPSAEKAQKAMGSGFEAEYRPVKDRAAAVRAQYGRYSRLGSFIEQETAADRAGRQTGKYRQIREAAFECNRELHERNLILYTFGNASALDREKGVFAIKPSGVSYEKLKAEDMVVVDLEGKVVDGNLRPSSDTATHAVLYRNFPDIRGVTHTHSPHAVAFAQAMRPIPILGTTHADHAPTDVPCTAVMSDKAIGGDYEMETGLLIVEAFKRLSYEEIQMVLVACHGPFTWGATPDKAVMNAVMVEELARIAWMTLSLDPKARRMKRTLIDKHYLRKHGKNAYYGQK